MDAVSGDDWSCKTWSAPVKSSPPTNKPTPNFLQAGCHSGRQTNWMEAYEIKLEGFRSWSLRTRIIIFFGSRAWCPKLCKELTLRGSTVGHGLRCMSDVNWHKRKNSIARHWTENVINKTTDDLLWPRRAGWCPDSGRIQRRAARKKPPECTWHVKQWQMWTRQQQQLYQRNSYKLLTVLKSIYRSGFNQPQEFTYK